MKQKHLDGAVAFGVGLIVISGGIVTWQAYTQWVTASEAGGHMGSSMTTMHGTHPVWYLFGTILLAVVTTGVYLGVRDTLGGSLTSSGTARSSATAPATDRQPTGSNTDTEMDPRGEEETTPESTPGTERPLLDLLPADERRILQPVLSSPGLTQIELRDRSDFSKSKVSQTVTDLEKRGLLYREPQGRTYRVYPAEDLESDSSGSKHAE